VNAPLFYGLFHKTINFRWGHNLYENTQNQKAIKIAAEWSLLDNVDKEYNFYLLVDWSCGVYLHSDKRSENIVFGLLRIFDNRLNFFDDKGTLKKDDIVLDAFGGKFVFYNNYPRFVKKDWTEITEGRDFFKYNKMVDWVVTHPPYSILDDIFKKLVIIRDSLCL